MSNCEDILERTESECSKWAMGYGVSEVQRWRRCACEDSLDARFGVGLKVHQHESQTV